MQSPCVSVLASEDGHNLDGLCHTSSDLLQFGPPFCSFLLYTKSEILVVISFFACRFNLELSRLHCSQLREQHRTSSVNSDESCRPPSEQFICLDIAYNLFLAFSEDIRAYTALHNRHLSTLMCGKG